MQIIDLSLELSNELPVFPGDPPVDIEQLMEFDKDGWNMKRLHLNGHDGTHVNAQIHGQVTGKTLDDYELSAFFGKTVLYETADDIERDIGLIVTKKNIDMDLAKIIAAKKPKFVGLAAEFEMDVDVEKFFFAQDLLCFENLANTDKLPKRFFFYGIPLKIKGGDGSPIRAFAVID